MTNRERFQAVLNFRMPDDRLPAIEWAGWWDQTLARWHTQGLDPSLPWQEVAPSLGLDRHYQVGFPHYREGFPQPACFGGSVLESEAEYEALLPLLYPLDRVEECLALLRRLKPGHDAGDYPIWITFPGAFWFPRELLGIENHLFSFYDEPELYHRILEDLADYHLQILERVYQILTPDFMTFAEDMSYNNGPMISRELFDEFLAPYYRRVVPVLRAHGTKVIVDSDGDISRMIPWMQAAGIQGVLPLERQAGVDIAALREKHPDFLFIGAFDKMTMRRGIPEMRAEFERLLPVMKTGGFIPSVDHQTPPDCPLERYRVYVEMLREYGEKAVL